ncbi:hypothetical protein Sste5346_001923 [Sporothrix stenoceras]|uniref:Uncharacterized protein n=1 Tax=Sporothrix stenoceras TaxID=5173 RepID=A0ABR3ZLH4_9PEZI
MSPSHLDTGGGTGRPTKNSNRNVSGSSSSGEEEDWHSTPASPTMKPKTTDTGSTKEMSAQTNSSAAANSTAPATAFTQEGGVVSGSGGSRQGSDQNKQGSHRPGSTSAATTNMPPSSIPPSSGPASESGRGREDAAGDNFSDIVLDDQRPSTSIASSVAASDAEEAARVFATPPQPSTPKMPPLPARPPPARISTASILAASDSGRSFVDGDDSAFDVGPSSSSSVAGNGKGPAPPLPPRHSSSHSYSQSQSSFAGAPIFPPPPKRRSQRMSGRPMSLASVMGGGNGGYSSGTESPTSSTASPRSSSFYSHGYLNRPLPQTPTSVVSGGGNSRPSSYSFFSPTSFMSSATAHFSSNTSQTRPLSMTQDVPRPLRLQPSLPVRRGTSTPGSSNNGYTAATAAGITESGEPADYDMTWLRAHQAAARMARRRHREQVLGAQEFERHRQRLESHEGTFEVVAMFLQRLARAENDALEPENFPRSLAEQKGQQEAMELMRQETVEALTPLLAYGPTEPPPTSSTRPARSASSATAKSTATAASSSKKNAALPGHVIGLPPTPPLSPRRNDPRRESGMSSITETSLNGGGHGDDASSINGGAQRQSTDTWRLSMKRASTLFGGWGSGNTNSNNPPASTTRFSGD